MQVKALKCLRAFFSLYLWYKYIVNISLNMEREMKFTKTVFKNMGLFEAGEELGKAADNINKYINWGEAQMQGDGINWASVYDRLKKYAEAASKLHRLGIPEVTEVLPSAINTNTLKFAPKSVEIIHAMHMGTALCNTVKGKPHEWPPNHFRTSGSNTNEVTCHHCVAILSLPK